MGKNDKTLENLLDNYNFIKEKPEKVKLKNPIFNGMFHGGIPLGSRIQIVAQSGVGKTVLTLQLCKELLDLKYKVLYIDVEKGVTENMLQNVGVSKYLYQDNYKKGTFYHLAECDCNVINSVIQDFSDNGYADIIVVDSLGALTSGIYKGDNGSDVNNPKVGADSRSIKIVMKTINDLVIHNKTTFILINHLAQTIGSYIPTEKPVGGRAPQYLSDIIIHLTSKKSPFDSSVVQKVEFEATKDRFGQGKCKVPFYIRPGYGIFLPLSYREVVEDIDVVCNKKPHKLVEMKGAGYGTMFLNDKEIKFRGETQLCTLITENLSAIGKYISPKIFEAKAPQDIETLFGEVDKNSNTKTAKTTKTTKKSSNDTSNDIPEEFKDLGVVEKNDTDIIFKKGVDITGQLYSISYNFSSNTIISDIDGNISTISSPSRQDLLDEFDILNKYLQSLIKED